MALSAKGPLPMQNPSRVQASDVEGQGQKRMVAAAVNPLSSAGVNSPAKNDEMCLALVSTNDCRCTPCSCGRKAAYLLHAISELTGGDACLAAVRREALRLAAA